MTLDRLFNVQACVMFLGSKSVYVTWRRSLWVTVTWRQSVYHWRGRLLYMSQCRVDVNEFLFSLQSLCSAPTALWASFPRRASAFSVPLCACLCYIFRRTYTHLTSNTNAHMKTVIKWQTCSEPTRKHTCACTGRHNDIMRQATGHLPSSLELAHARACERTHTHKHTPQWVALLISLGQGVFLLCWRRFKDEGRNFLQDYLATASSPERTCKWKWLSQKPD